MSLLGCDAWKEAGRKAFTALDLELTMGGTFTSLHTDGSSDTVVYSGGPWTKSLTRETFDPVDFYGSIFSKPSTNKFAAVVNCCCWRCRFSLLPPSDYSTAPDDFQSIGTGTITWNRSQYSAATGITTNTSGTIGLHFGFINRSPPDGAYPTDITEQTIFCRNNSESGRIGQPMSLYASLDSSIVIPRGSFSNLYTGVVPYTYSDSAGRSSTGNWNPNLSLPGPGLDNDYAFIPMDSCDDVIEVTATASMSGTITTPGTWSDSVSALATTLTVNLS